MKLLLDTQCWLWMTAAPERFRDATRALLLDPGTDLFLSAASAWELAIKHALGKLPLPEQPDRYVVDRLRRTRTSPLAITVAHAVHVAALPPLHRDPFDRMLVAQAQLERLPIVTADRQLAAYDVETIEA
jgi:PIN domain nuclease of toxin-antitoxin system